MADITNSLLHDWLKKETTDLKREEVLKLLKTKLGCETLIIEKDASWSGGCQVAIKCNACSSNFEVYVEGEATKVKRATKSDFCIKIHNKRKASWQLCKPSCLEHAPWCNQATFRGKATEKDLTDDRSFCDFVEGKSNRTDNDSFISKAAKVYSSATGNNRIITQDIAQKAAETVRARLNTMPHHKKYKLYSSYYAILGDLNPGLEQRLDQNDNGEILRHILVWKGVNQHYLNILAPIYFIDVAFLTISGELIWGEGDDEEQLLKLCKHALLMITAYGYNSPHSVDGGYN